MEKNDFDKDEIINIINNFVSKVAEQNPKLVTAYLFGSFAKNNERSESDIDIALFIDDLNDEERFDLQVHLILLATEFDIRIEPHPFSYSDFKNGNPFVLEIINTGIEIKPRTPNTV
ncbi:MAG TPA: nucleotidyltransferase domain-containing protein [Ignavibacteria bacterium]|nr:nucleotidyltransferase domain-containing protein [Ignavibacteria bacterium]